MRIVVCPQCGHQNRSAIVATICDSCGDDISTVAAANEVADRFEAEPDDPVLTPATAPVEDVAPEPEPEDDPAPPEKIAWIAVRLVLSAAVIYGSITLSLKVPLGSALAGDPLLAGSVAILGGAAAVSGLVLLLVGTGHKSGGVTLSLRGLGVLLAFIGIWAVAAIATQGAFQKRTPIRPRRVREDIRQEMLRGGGEGMPRDPAMGGPPAPGGGDENSWRRKKGRGGKSGR